MLIGAEGGGNQSTSYLETKLPNTFGYQLTFFCGGFVAKWSNLIFLTYAIVIIQVEKRVRPTRNFRFSVLKTLITSFFFCGF